MSTTTYSVRTMLLSFERRVLRAGGQRGALANAHAAVLEGRERAALRAEAHESLTAMSLRTR
ncbi:hypothetical protein KGQ20_12425 [Catenulispora sp. NF23]|uniref:Uncharacterized protein n=1 Tax=Catenulispora pinistramenti TaxID=2705254 RepID=A0ABS5KJL5_9ACTN|nr:hypothetical protein [Catenulispora pinistramenti]MBS2533576.1 hypothetical protein [Catenulispora pinistramenti]MBS2546503.1 hypothetical protein [Catenulispora pinistramenti]